MKEDYLSKVDRDRPQASLQKFAEMLENSDAMVRQCRVVIGKQSETIEKLEEHVITLKQRIDELEEQDRVLNNLINTMRDEDLQSHGIETYQP